MPGSAQTIHPSLHPSPSPSDPCGLIMNNQGIGVLHTSEAFFTAVAQALGIAFVPNPNSLCTIRSGLGYVGERLFRKAAPQVAANCQASDLLRLAESGGYAVVHMQLAQGMIGTQDGLPSWRVPSPRSWWDLMANGTHSALFRTWAHQAGLDPYNMPQSVLFLFHGCPHYTHQVTPWSTALS